MTSSHESDFVGWRDQIESYAVRPRAWCPVHAPASVYKGDSGRRQVTRGEAWRSGYACDVCCEPLAPVTASHVEA